MGYIEISSDTVSISVTFGDYVDSNSPNFNQEIYDRIDGLKPVYKRENLVLIYEDKYNTKVTRLKMLESMTSKEWSLTHDPNFNPANEGVMAFIVSDINGATSWVDRDAFVADLMTLMK